ncbi:uncharacterized protein [Ptychodera flava]|uniref:uncharacterized protein isoform X2 n=1 Tax=Ptychodera flava TaxID=63121 RepID=UPI003969EA91
MKSAEIMNNKDCPLSDLEPSFDRTNCNGGSGTGSAFNNNCGVPQACQECCAMFKSLKRFDNVHELVKPLETLTEKLCQRYQDNTLSMEDASIIVQSIMQYYCITWEYGMSNQENSIKDLNPWYEGNHIEHQSTLHKDPFRLVECHSHNGDSYDSEISTDCGKNYVKNSNDGAHNLNSRAHEMNVEKVLRPSETTCISRGLQ